MQDRIAWVQALRAVAANMVVICHFSLIEVKYSHGFAILPGADILGPWGVNIFFAISGFVIALSTGRRPQWREFIWARVSRIYPIYWVYTAIVFAVATIAPVMVNASIPVTPSLWRSVVLFPSYTPPLLAVGWSLVYEMYFYLVFAAALAFRVNLVLLLAVWAAALLLPIDPIGPISTVVFSPLGYFFISGAALGIGFLRLGGGRAGGSGGLLCKLGDASYSIYLSHVFVISAIGRLFSMQPWHSVVAEYAFFIACIVAVNWWGWISYKWIEGPLLIAARTIPLKRMNLFQTK